MSADRITFDGVNLGGYLTIVHPVQLPEETPVSPDPVENAVAAAKLRAWVDMEHAERPTRGHLRWIARRVLEDRDELFTALEEANRRAANAERERLADSRRRKLGTAEPKVDVPGMVKAYEDLRTAYEQAEAERNHYAHQDAGLRKLVVELRGDVERLTAELDTARTQAATRGQALLLRLLDGCREAGDESDGEIVEEDHRHDDADPHVLWRTTTTRIRLRDGAR